MEKMEGLLKILTKIQSDFGVEIWKEGARCLSAFKDVSPMAQKEFTIFKDLIESGASTTLLGAANKTGKERERDFNLAKSLLSKQSFYTEDIIEQACECFLYVVTHRQIHSDKNVEKNNHFSKESESNNQTQGMSSNGTQRTDKNSATTDGNVYTQDDSTEESKGEESLLSELYKIIVRPIVVGVLIALLVSASGIGYTFFSTGLSLKESIAYYASCSGGVLAELSPFVKNTDEDIITIYSKAEELYYGGFASSRLKSIRSNSEQITAETEKDEVIEDSKTDETEMMEIVWSIFNQNNVNRVYCADYDHNGWYEAFVEENNGIEEEGKTLWFVTHIGETEIVDQGEYLTIDAVIYLSECALLAVSGRHGLDTIYYVDNDLIGAVKMPDEEWWYAVYERDGSLWGTRIEYPDGKEYVDYELRYDIEAKRLVLANGDVQTGSTIKTVIPSPTPTKHPTFTPTQRPTATPKPRWNNYPHWTLTDDYCTLQKGDSGDRVRQIQAKLIEYGYLSGGVDGKYGVKTKQAIEDFQRNNGIFGSYGIATTMTQAILFDEQCIPAWVSKVGSYINHGNQLEWYPDIALPQVTLWMSTESEIPITAFILGWYTEDINGQRVYGKQWYWDWECYEVDDGGSVENYIPVAEMANPNSVYSFYVCVEEIYYADGTVYSDFGIPWEKSCYCYDKRGTVSEPVCTQQSSDSSGNYTAEIELVNVNNVEPVFCWEPFYCRVKLKGTSNASVKLGFRFICDDYTIEESWDDPVKPGMTEEIRESFPEMEGSEGSIYCEIFILHDDGSETLLGSKSAHCGI